MINNNEEEEVIRKDRELYPKCSYSVSLSESCSLVSGKFNCETLKSIQRLCPDSRPVNVYEFRSQREEEGSRFPESSHTNPFGSTPFPPMLDKELGSRGDLNGSLDTFSEMKNLLKGFGFSFGDGTFSFGDDSQGVERKTDIDVKSKGGKPKTPPKGFISGPTEDV